MEKDYILDSFTDGNIEELDKLERRRKVEKVIPQSSEDIQRWFVDNYNGDEDVLKTYLALFPKYISEEYAVIRSEKNFERVLVVLTLTLLVSIVACCASSMSAAMMVILFTTVLLPALSALQNMHFQRLLVDDSLQNSLDFQSRFLLMQDVARNNVETLQSNIHIRIDQLLAVKEELQVKDYDSEISYLQSLIESDEHSYKFLLERMVKEAGLVSQNVDAEAHLLGVSLSNHELEKLEKEGDDVVFGLEDVSDESVQVETEEEQFVEG